MNRDIKFKAYHKPTNRIFEVYSFTNDEVFEVSNDGIHSTQTLPAKKIDCILLQYVGCKDKNGIEIYEGYVCESFKGNSYLGGLSDVYEVVFSNDRLMFCFKCIDSVNKNKIGTIAKKSDGSPYSIESKKTEIIGNVYIDKKFKQL